MEGRVVRLGTISSRRETKIRILGRRPPPAAERTLGNCATTTTFCASSFHHRPSNGVCRSGGRRQHRRSARMLQTVARDAYLGSPGAGAEEGQPLRLRHRSSAARGEPSGAQRSRETAARIRPGCRAHAARRKRQMGEQVGSLSGLRGARELLRDLAGGSQVGFSPMCTPDVVVVATPVPPWFVKRPPFKFGDSHSWGKREVITPCVGVNRNMPP